jgi:hypothetical protein
MNNFQIRTADDQTIRFQLYVDVAPITSAAFIKSLPFSRTFIHARVSGQEIWTDHGANLDIIQENSSVFTVPGEIVSGPLKPARNKTSNCIGIYYGEGKGLDGCNIFGKVLSEDIPKLKALGEMIWKHGEQKLLFELVG